MPNCISDLLLILQIHEYLGYDPGNLQGLIKILAPFIYALAIAYFISPLVNFIEDKLFGLLNHHRLKRGLSILVTYIIIFSTAVLLLSFVLPQLISSIQEIALLSGNTCLR